MQNIQRAGQIGEQLVKGQGGCRFAPPDKDIVHARAPRLRQGEPRDLAQAALGAVAFKGASGGVIFWFRRSRALMRSAISGPVRGVR